MIDDIIEDTKLRMGKSVASLSQDFDRVRTGRAHTSLLDHITVEYYGSLVPLNQVANVGVDDARTLSVTPGKSLWYRSWKSHYQLRPWAQPDNGGHGYPHSTAAVDGRAP